MKPNTVVNVILVVLSSLVATAGWCAPGDLVWQNRGQSAPFGGAFAIDIGESVAVASGQICSTPTPTFSTCDWFVRAHDSRTGATLWEDRVDGGGGYDSTEAVAVEGSRAFAVGWVRAAATGFDFVVRAYRVREGTLLWEKRIDRGGKSERAFSVAASKGRVFVAGSVFGTDGRHDFSLLVFDARTGGILWESQKSVAPFGGLANGVRAKGERVFVAGQVGSATPNLFSLVVRAHNAKTGALLWEDDVADAITTTPVTPDAMAVSGNLLFVGAAVADINSNIFAHDFLLRAYDVRSGALMWTDTFHVQDGSGAAALTLGAGRLFAAGWDCDDTVFNCHYHVRAYEPHTGNLLWEDRFTGPGGDILLPLPRAAFAAHGKQVFVGTGVLNTENRYEWSVRAYNAFSGIVQWEDRVDEGDASLAYGLKAEHGRLFAAGQIQRTDGGLDFVVRTYDTEKDHDDDRDRDRDREDD